MAWTARATYVDYDRVVLSCPYDPRFVDEIKGALPPPFRSYDPATKAWTARLPYCERAITILRLFFPSATVEEWEGHTKPPPRPGNLPLDPYATLHLLPSAPPELIKAAYLALSKLHHPDRGGDKEAMQRVNAAYDKLKH